jgi:hypothetical protein
MEYGITSNCSLKLKERKTKTGGKNKIFSTFGNKYKLFKGKRKMC